MVCGSFEQEPTEKNKFETNFDYVQGMFHKNEITGLDVCIRKHLIVTCSKDKTVTIWDYSTRTLEIQHLFPEECHAVAFHPSGLHIVVAMADKIEIHNVLATTLGRVKQNTLKGCSEIKFAHGGHMFACVAQQKDIHVYNFYT